jgi:hypothetical protein
MATEKPMAPKASQWVTSVIWTVMSNAVRVLVSAGCGLVARGTSLLLAHPEFDTPDSQRGISRLRSGAHPHCRGSNRTR